MKKEEFGKIIYDTGNLSQEEKELIAKAVDFHCSIIKKYREQANVSPDKAMDFFIALINNAE